MSETPEILFSALRQYQHNQPDGELVIAFERDETIKVVDALTKQLADIRDENYSDLMDQIDESWGSSDSVGRNELEAFMYSRMVHRPTTKLREQLAEQQWISVDDRLPENGLPVLMAGSHDVPVTGYFAAAREAWYAYDEDYYVVGVTHWMPTPALPQEPTT